MGGGGGGQQPDLYKEYYGELLAKAQMAPNVYATEAQFDPAYSALNMNVLNDTLFGTNNLSVSTPSFAAGLNPSYANFPNVGTPGISGGIPSSPIINSPFSTNDNQRFGRPGHGYLDYEAQQAVNNYATLQAAANKPQPTQTISSPGLLDIYQRAAPLLANAQAASTTATRTANANDLRTLGPQAVSAMNAADPATAGLLNSMTTDAQRGLDLGANLDPSLMRLATQGVLSSRTGTLGGTGNAGDFNTALGLSSFGQQLRSNRQQYAGGVASQRGQYYGGAINSVMNGGSFVNPLSGVSSAMGLGQGGPRLFGSDINAQQTYSDANNAANAASISSANNSAALTSSAIGGVATLGGVAILAF
jgi:hypothetical protein